MDDHALKPKSFTAEQARAIVKREESLPDGSFPISSCIDVGNAVMSLGRTVNPTSEVVKHIRTRSRALGCHLPLRVLDKMHAVERYVERKDHRKKANAVDFWHISTLGETPIDRPDHISSEVWRSMLPDHRTVKAEAIRRIIERNYAQAVEDAEMSGWKPGKSHYDPNEYYFSKRWPTGDPRAPEVSVRSILVREADSLDWQLRPVSSFASGTLAEKMPAGIVRHVRKDRMNIPLTYRGGPGSGHFGHAGRPGEIGGSQDSGGDAASGEAGRRRKGVKVRPDSDGYTIDDEIDALNSEEATEGEREELAQSLPNMGLSQIAREIRKDWKKVNFAAVPYLEAMGSLSKISDNYFMDTGSSVVAYFLSNAGQWRGDTARAVKAELKRRLKAG